MRFIASVIATATIGITLPVITPSAASASQATNPRVYAWGDNSQRELADGTTTTARVPVGSTLVPDSATDSSGTFAVVPSEVVGGLGNYVMRTTSGQVIAWGSNSAGQSYGNSAVDVQPVIDPTPIDLPGSFGGHKATAVGVAASTGNSYALLDNNVLVGWGSDINSLLGDNLTTRSAPKIVDTNVLSFGCSSDVCFSIKSNGSGGTVLWGWGSGSNGNFGEGGTTNHGTPTLLTNGIANPTQVIGGNRSIAVLDSAGVVHTMGFNAQGELGNGNTVGSSTPQTVLIPAGTTITSIAAWQFGYFALDSAGGLWTWGSGNGPIGDGTISTDRPTPVKITTDLDGNALPPLVQVTGGTRHAIARTADGRVYTWGDNTSGQAGNGNQTESELRPTRISLPRAATWVSTTADGTYQSSLAILTAPPATTPTRTLGTILAQVTTAGSTKPQIVESDGRGSFLHDFNPSDQSSAGPSYSGGGTAYFASNRVIDTAGTSSYDLFSGAVTAPTGGSAVTKVLRRDSTNEVDPYPFFNNFGLVFATDLNGPAYHLQTINLGTNAVTDLTPNNSGDRHPTEWLGSTCACVLFQRGSGAGTDIWIASTNDSATLGGATPALSNVTQLTGGSTGVGVGVADGNPIGLDRTHIAWDQVDGSGRAQVMVATYTGFGLTDIHPLTTDAGVVSTYTPAVAPDGQSQVVVGGIDTAGNHDLYVYDWTTGARLAGPLYNNAYTDVRYPSWGDDFTAQFASGANAANPQYVPLSNLNQNGATPQVTGCNDPAACGQVSSAPGGNPGRLPGGNPGRLPGGNPGRLPGGNPGRLPGGNPGRLPGANPGRLPGGNPGRLPGGNPGRLPGGNPGRLGFTDLGDTTELGTNPLIRNELKQILLSSVRVDGGWAQYLVGTPLANTPIQSLTLLDFLSLPTVPDVHLKDLDTSQSALGKLSLVSWLLGDTRLGDITAPAGETWCGDLTTYLQTIGSTLSCDAYGQRAADGSVVSGGLNSASFLALEIEGIPIDAFPGLDKVTLGNIDFLAHDGWLGEYPLAGIDMLHSAFGNLKLKDLPFDTTDPSTRTAINCTIVGVDCSSTSSQTIYGAASAASRADAPTVFRDNASIVNLGHAADAITLTQAILGIAQNLVGDPLDGVSLDDLGFNAQAAGAGTSTTGIEIKHWLTDQYSLGSGATATITLPAGFSYTPSSALLDNGNTVATPAEPTINGQQVTFSLNNLTFGSYVRISFGVFTSRDLTTQQVPIQGIAIHSTDVDETLGHATSGISVIPALGPNSTSVSSPATIAPDNVYSGYITKAGESLYYAIPAPAIAGSQLDVYLDHLPVDADLLVYHPLHADAATPLRPIPSDGAGPVSAQPDQQLGLASQAESLIKESVDDYPVANLPLAGVSDNRGLQFEHVGVLTFRATGGYYIIQVTGHGTATSLKPFTLRATVTPPNGLPNVPRVAFPNAGSPSSAVTSVPANTQTVILTNKERLQKVYGAARAQTAMNAVSQLTSNVNLHAAAVPVDGWSDVEADYAAWDTTPGEPEIANDIVRDINTHVDALLGPGRSSLRHIVVAGTDEIIPMARLLDQTQSANERDFAGEVASATADATNGNNALLSSEAAGYVLSDDPYASFAPRALLGGYLYPPSVAIGRLVETPEDIAGVITQFLNPKRSGDAPGTLHPATGLATGYDFFQDMADAIKTSLSPTLNTTVPELSGTWNRQQLRDAYSDNPNGVPDIAEVTGHATPTYFTPGDLLSNYDTSELAGKDLAQKVLFSLGCHSGFSITDYLSTGGVPDFPQVVSHQGIAAYVGQTGYGLGGSTTTLTYGEQLMASFAHAMTGRTLGQALAQAKLDYLSRSPNVYDAKALEEATFYGLPMFTIGGPDNDAPPAGLTPTADPNISGLTSATLTVDNPIQSSDNWRLHNTSDGGYYTLVNQQQNSNGLTAVEQHEPIQPRVDLNVSAPGQVARGVLVTGLTSSDQGQFDPVLSRPTIDNAADEPEQQVADVTWPLTPQDLGTVPTLSGGLRQTASFTLGRFRATGLAVSGPSTGKTFGVQRRYTHLAATVYYQPTGSTKTSDPYFSSVTLTPNSGGGTDITALPNAPVAIKRVLLLVHLTSADGAWVPVELTRDALGVWHGTTSLSGDYLEYIAQAVDANGNVGITTEIGKVYDPLGTANDPGPSGSTTTVSVPASTQLGTPIPVTVTVSGGPNVATAPSGTANVSDGTTSCTATIYNGTGTCSLTHNSLGSFTVTATFGDTNAFTGSSGSSNAAVTPAPLTITASSASSMYGSAPGAVTPTYSGLVNGDTAASLTTQPTCSSAATATSAPGTYVNSCTGASSPRYTITYVNGTQTVTNGTLHVQASAGTLIYGSLDGALTPAYTGFVNGDGPSSLTAAPTCTGATLTSGVGTYPLTCSGGVSSKYTIVYDAATLTVTKAPLAITASSAVMTYGGTVPTITPLYSGFKNSDTAASLSTQPTCSTTATPTLPVNPNYISSCSGATASNYTISSLNGQVSINPAPLNVTATSASRQYGAANPAITPQYSGFRNGQTSSVMTSPPTCTANASPASPVGGSYSTTCSGGSATNYSFTYFSGALTVTQAPLTVNAPSVGKVYGDANPAFTAGYTGFLNGDGPSAIGTAPTCTSPATAATHAGTATITCSGGSSQNYALTTYAPGTLTISQAPLTVTASSGTRLYGAANPAVAASYTGFKNADTSAVITPKATCSASASATSPVDSYPTFCTGANAQDYTFVYVNGTLAVTPAPLQTKASNVTRTYGSPNPTITPTYTGFVAGDDASKLSQAPACSSTATPSSPVSGTYATTCSGAAATNYAITYVSGTLTITKAPLTVTAPSPGKVYGQPNPAFPPTYSGFVNGDSATTAFSTQPTCTAAGGSNPGAGSYAVSCSGGVSANYAPTYVGGTFEVGKAVLTATANNVTRTYGAANGTLGVTYSGFVNGDNASVVTTPATCTTTATPTSNVGTYAITCANADTANYAISYVPGTLAVTPAPVTVNAPSATRQYGTPNPTFTPTYVGLQNGQTALTPAPSCTTTATATSVPGSYPIHCVASGSNPNYAVTFGPDGTLTVTKADTVVTQTAVSVVGTILAFQVRYTAILKSASGATLAGETVSFTSTNTSTGTAACSAVTDATGTATCTSNLLTILTVLTNGSTTATFGGDSNYNGSTNTTPYTLN